MGHGPAHCAQRHSNCLNLTEALRNFYATNPGQKCEEGNQSVGADVEWRLVPTFCASRIDVAIILFDTGPIRRNKST